MNLKYLIETELQKAEVVIAAKSITDKLQNMAETLAKLDANDVMPLGDAMRDVFGGDAAKSFEESVSETIRGLIEQIRDAKNSISDNIDALENGEPMSDMGEVDDIDSMFGDEAGAEPAEDETLDAATDTEEPEAPAEEDFSDMFSGAAEESNAAGRGIKQESARSKKQILESKILRRFKSIVSEGHTVDFAVEKISKELNRSKSKIAESIMRANKIK